MLAFTPVFTMFPIPATARVLLLAMLSVATAAALPATAHSGPSSAGTFIQSAALEFSFGLLLACGIFCAFSAIAFAGRALDIQIGFGIGQVFDPVSRTQVPIITSIFLYASVLLFFLLDGHHALLRGIAYTLSVVYTLLTIGDGIVTQVSAPPFWGVMRHNAPRLASGPEHVTTKPAT